MRKNRQDKYTLVFKRRYKYDTNVDTVLPQVSVDASAFEYLYALLADTNVRYLVPCYSEVLINCSSVNFAAARAAVADDAGLMSTRYLLLQTMQL